MSTISAYIPKFLDHAKQGGFLVSGPDQWVHARIKDPSNKRQVAVICPWSQASTLIRTTNPALIQHIENSGLIFKRFAGNDGEDFMFDNSCGLIANNPSPILELCKPQAETPTPPVVTLDKIDRFISTNFSIHSTTAKIQDAKIIGLGDDHVLDNLDITRMSLINALAKDGDIVLLEAVPAGIVVEKLFSPHTSGIQANVIVMGWDNIALRDAAAANVKKLIAIREEIKASTDQEAIARLNKEFWELKSSIDDIGITKRNQSLIAILSQQIGEIRVFVIAGETHLKELTLMKYLSARKHVVLLPKTQPISSEEKARRAREYFA